MIDAGYDPHEAPKVFQVLQREDTEGDVSEPYYLGSHPRLEERITSYRTAVAEMANVNTVTHESAGPDEAYEEAISKVLLDNAQFDLNLRRTERARSAIQRHLAHRPQSARGYFMLGELYRRTGASAADVAAAIAAYECATQLDPTDATAHRELGLEYRAEGKTARASRELQRYLELSADAPDAPIIQSYLTEMQHGKAR